jgi:hypothetical protein
VKLRLTFKFIVTGLEIDASRISKHNEGLAKPKGIKVKEKSVRGSRRPISGFEKATSKRKKNTNATVQLPPQSTSTVYKCLNQISHKFFNSTNVYFSFYRAIWTL